MPGPIGRCLAVGAALTAWLLAGGAARADGPRAPPNVVLIVSDDQAWTDYGFMGHADIRTPHLDALAREGVLFRRGSVPTALCRPSLMTLVTGRYAHRHGVTGNDPSPRLADPESEVYARLRERLVSFVDRFDTLPERLADRGYLSHQSGKWWEGSYRRGGFTHGMTRGFPHPGGRHGDDGLAIGREGLQPIEEFLDVVRSEGRPFFLWYAPFLPHTPHDPPPRLLERRGDPGPSETVSRYHGMCEWFDETCGQLIGLLEDRGLRSRTLVVYVTDNGWIQDPHANGFAARSKQSPYEGGVRTPVIFSWPGRLRPADRPEHVSSIDLVPTLLSATGARPIAGLPGLDLWPHLVEGTPIEREAVFGEGFAHDIADLEDPEASLLYRWCVEGRWKLILTYDGEVHRYHDRHPRTERGPQLFDLEADPHETTNRAARHPEVVARLAARIAAWWPVQERRTITVTE
jgi:uncharacterized sulfatase